jgi:ATP synthase protein I
VLTAVLAVVGYVYRGPQVALSAALGGGISTVASLTVAVIVFRKNARDLMEMVRAFYIAEAAKFGVTIVLFVVVLVTMKRMLVPLVMFGAFVAILLVHWLVLPRAMRRLDRGQFGG